MVERTHGFLFETMERVNPNETRRHAKQFTRAKAPDLQEILETLVALGHAQQTGEHFTP